MGNCAGKSAYEEPYRKRDAHWRLETTTKTRKNREQGPLDAKKHKLLQCSVSDHKQFVNGWRRCFLLDRVYPWDKVDLDTSLENCLGEQENSQTIKNYLEGLDDNRAWYRDFHSQFDENCELRFLMKCIEKVSLFDDGKVSKKITFDIKCIVNDIFNLAYDKYPTIFRDFKIHLVGSMSERTKLMFPSEHDFFVTLPGLLSNRLCTFQNSTKHSVDIGLILIKIIYFERHQIFRPYRHYYQLKNICECSRTTTLHVMFDNYDIRKMIDIDICLGVPAELLDRSDLSRPMYGAEMSWITAVKCQETEHKLHYFYDRTHEYLDTTSVFLENGYFREYPANDNRLKCYRAAKFLTGLLFPTFRKSNSRRCQQICRSPVIPTYYLKSAMFYLMMFYEDGAYWKDDVVGNRLIELFIVLKLVIEKQYFASVWLPFKELPFFPDVFVHDIVTWPDELFSRDCLGEVYDRQDGDDAYVIHVKRLLDEFIDCLYEARMLKVGQEGDTHSRLCNALFSDVEYNLSP